jgi:hypothetical protein
MKRVLVNRANYNYGQGLINSESFQVFNHSPMDSSWEVCLPHSPG